MQMNFNGLVNLHNLPKTMPLLPLYEAVINAIQSIEDTQRKDGVIEVTIERKPELIVQEEWESDIENIIIKDNGVGFTNENFNSFDTYATEFKLQKGCKGVGRMLWLKAFSEVEVESIYEDQGKKKKRTFLFNAEQSVSHMHIEDVSDDIEPTTIVKLMNLKDEYKKKCPKGIDTIARSILNHCFAYYVMGSVPKIIVKDNKKSTDLDVLMKTYVDKNIKQETLYIKGSEFQLIHVKNYMNVNHKHVLNLCANHWVVKTENLIKYLTGMNTNLKDEKGEFTYNGYVLSKVLDENVNRERTKFELPEEASLVENIGLQEIYQEIKPAIQKFLQKDIEDRNMRKKEIITNFVYDKKPKYRYLLQSIPNLVDMLPLTDDVNKLEMELFKHEQKYKLDLKKEGKNLENEFQGDQSDYKAYLKKRTEYAEKLSDVGKSDLAEYVMHRKVILDVLMQNLKYKDEAQKNYAYEKNIHKLIFPMVKTSDDINYMNHNLWIIDERLAYHEYLASDKKLKSIDVLQNDGNAEPDILIFDSPFAFTDENEQPFRNITIIEFKRPGRGNYSEKVNPIAQIKEYMDDILQGKIRSKNGEYLENTDNVRFYCYVLCDIDPTLRKIARHEDMKKTPDQMGYYRYYDVYNAYLEVIPYQKMLKDSIKRNQILFDKLFNQ